MSAVAAAVVVAAMLPVLNAPAAVAAPAISQGCADLNDGEFDEADTTGIGKGMTFFAGDSITLTISRTASSPASGAWRFEVGGRVVSRQSLVGSSISFTYKFTSDVYTEVFLWAPTTGAGQMSGSCVPTTQEAFRITTWPNLPWGMEGEPYSATLGASGGAGGYSWKATSGALPPGVGLTPDGVLSGTPTEPGLFEFTVEVTDASGATMVRGVQIEIGQVEVTEEWVPLCHLTDTGYEFDVAPSSVLDGEGEHGGHSGDIIPGPEFGAGGRNWGADGQTIFWDNCTAPLVDIVDLDEDGLINAVDSDDDGDGIADVVDSDDDGDGMPDAQEVQTLDTDADGTPDAADADDDGDGVADVVDSDDDGDGIPDVSDTGSVAVPDQDADGLPDALDADDDGDCVADSVDGDRDGDGVADAVDPDRDNDGISNALDVDEDGDSIPNLLDPDVDGNGVANGESSATRSAAGLKQQCPADTDPDGDGIPNAKDTDDDGDGIPDAQDRIASRPWIDTDGDGVPNVKDADIDNDGVPNAEDPDVDGDGVVDTRDKDANADGIVETRRQPLAKPFRLPAITPGVPVRLTSGPLPTVAGQNASVDVSCAAPAKTRSKGAGDIGAPDATGRCLVIKDGKGLRLFVFPGKETVVSVSITAPAVDNFHPLSDVVQRRIG